MLPIEIYKTQAIQLILLTLFNAITSRMVNISRKIVHQTDRDQNNAQIVDRVYHKTGDSTFKKMEKLINEHLFCTLKNETKIQLNCKKHFVYSETLSSVYGSNRQTLNNKFLTLVKTLQPKSED